jgi:hypothetical protein
MKNKPKYILNNFSESLSVISVKAQNIGVSWNERNSYDPWDNICTALYKELVILPLSEEISPNDEEYISMPRYDFLTHSYNNLYTLIIGPDEGGAIFAFHSFLARPDTEFRIMKCSRVNPETNIWLGDFVYVDLNQAEISLKLL